MIQTDSKKEGNVMVSDSIGGNARVPYEELKNYVETQSLRGAIPVPMNYMWESLMTRKRIQFEPHDLVNRDGKDWKQFKVGEKAEGVAVKCEFEYDPHGAGCYMTMTMDDGKVAQIRNDARVQILQP